MTKRMNKKEKRCDYSRQKHAFSRMRCCLLLSLVLFSLAACSKAPDKESLREQAIASYEAGDYETARNQFDEALMAGKGQVSAFQFDVLQYRGECELRLGRYDEAQKTYEALLAADTDKTRQETYQGIVDDLGNIGAVKAAVEQMDAGQYEEAYEALAAYAKLDGSLAGKLAWFNKGVCAEYQQKYDEAYELFQEYLEAYPDDADAKKEADFLRTR